MSTTVNHPCVRCKNKFKRDEQKCITGCNAFPNGIPYEYSWEKDVTKLPECNNGYKFEEKEDAKGVFVYDKK